MNSRVRCYPGLAGAVLVAGLLAPGCHQHERAVFDENDTGSRLNAIQAAAEAGDKRAVPDLIRSLESDDPAERLLANLALVRVTGQDFGFEHSAPRPAREAAAERWAVWYASQAASPGRP